MTTINQENAKQIRQPMQVEISVALADPGNPLTYSGYSSTAKVADGVLGQRSWPMRQLADLQGDGFPLDGSRELYETKTASQANGKLGVRGHVGQDADVTISRSRTIPSVEIRASGASAVVYGGTAYSLETGSANVLIGATSATLTFVPKDATVRAEVEYIGSTTEFVIRNDTLIRAVVSLRSDLSIDNPTLPESELNIEAFVSTDVSEYVAGVQEDTPVIYRAGYEGDMSRERRFYVAGQVTWADNILSIHAVDAVHFLDVEVPSAIFRLTNLRPTLVCRCLSTAIGTVLGEPMPTNDSFFYGMSSNATRERVFVPKGKTLRELVAFASNVFRLRDVPSRYCYQSDGTYIFEYVDAGEPSVSLRSWEKTPSRHIYEDDCSDVKKNVERKIGKIRLTANKVVDHKFVSSPLEQFTEVGSATWVKNSGIAVSFEEYTDGAMISLSESEVGAGHGYQWTPIAPLDGSGFPYLVSYDFGDGMWGDVTPASPLISSDVENGALVTTWNTVRRPVFSQFVDWNAYYDDNSIYKWMSQAAAWAGLVNAGVIAQDAESFDLKITGVKIAVDEYKATYTSADPGETIEIETPIYGRSFFTTSNEGSTASAQAYPAEALKNLFKRSNITGSFTWKGDPRMQPRDVVTFHRLDGTDEVITLENITITHEGGGTSAEITYRKGIV